MNEIKAMQNKFQASNSSCRYIRAYNGSFYDVLNEVEEIAKDLRGEIVTFLKNGYCTPANTISERLFEKERKESKKSESFINVTMPKIQKLMQIADFRDKYFKVSIYIYIYYRHIYIFIAVICIYKF